MDPREAPTLGGATPLLADAEAPAARIGDYELVRLIDTGGMGAVWEAHDVRLRRPVALKLLLGAARSPRNAERFRREALAAARLSHPGLVPVYELGDDHGRPFIAMGLVAGPSLAAALHTQPGSYRDRAELMAQVAEAVAYAHGQGVVHRDLKPSNILLEPLPGRPLGRPLVADFGLAKSADDDDSELTRPGEPLGTPSYMPPEQALGRQEEVGAHSDIYSLGAILYEALTGRAPFTGDNVVAIAKAVVEQDPLPPRLLARDVPRDLQTICLTCLAKDPHRRYPSAAALAGDLRAWLAGEDISARPPSAMAAALRHLRRHAVAWTVAGGALLTIAAITGWYLHDLASRRGEAEGARRRAEHLVAELQDEVDARTALEADRARSWVELFHDDFSGGHLDPRWQVAADAWSLADGRLVTRGPGPQLIRLRLPIAGDIRLSFTCQIEGPELNDVSCALAIPRGLGALTPPIDGYELKCGGWNNTRSLLVRTGRTLWERHEAPLAAGRRIHAEAERIGARLTYRIDGRTVFSHEDPQPLVNGDRCHLALIGYSTVSSWDDVRVERLGEPRATDLLDMAERRQAERRLDLAEDLFSEVLATSNDPSRRRRADAGIAGIARQREAQQTLIAASRSITDAWPGATVRIVDDGLHIDARRLGIADLSPIAGLPVQALAVDGNRIADLGPLAGMHLESLDLTSNPVRDLSVLRGMPLLHLSMADTQVTDLAPLAGMPIRTLRITGIPCPDLAPLAGMPLEMLAAIHCGIADLAPLRGAPLRILDVSGNRIADLAPLAGMHLAALTCAANRIADLAPLAGMPLATLDASGNRITGLEPLAGMPLHRLDLTGNIPADPGILGQRPPASLAYESPQLPDAFLDRLAEAWAGRPEAAPHLRRLEILRRLRRGDAAGLRAEANVLQDRRYLLIPRRLPWDEARKAAAALGGRLATVPDPGQRQALSLLLGPERCWLGAEGRDGRILWLDGSSEPDSGPSRPLRPGERRPCVLEQGRCLQTTELPTYVPTYPFLVEWE